VGTWITAVVQVGKQSGNEEKGRAEHRRIQDHARATERCQHRLHGADYGQPQPCLPRICQMSRAEPSREAFA